MSNPLSPAVLIAFVGGVVGATVVILALLWMRTERRRADREHEAAWHAAVNAPNPALHPSAERTIDALLPGENALAILTVEKSDDPQLVGQRIEIHKPLTALGRSAENDIVFAKDSPVSRVHAEIRERDGGLWFSPLISLDKTGLPKLPSFGTFINDQPVASSILLQHGDLIRLGRRVELRVALLGQQAESSPAQGQKTGEKTMLAFGVAQAAAHPREGASALTEEPNPADERTALVLGAPPEGDRDDALLQGGQGKISDQKTLLAFGAAQAEAHPQEGAAAAHPREGAAAAHPREGAAAAHPREGAPAQAEQPKTGDDQ